MRRLLAVSFVLAGLGIFAGPAGADDPTTTTAAPTCDSGADLQATIAAAAPGSTVRLSGCYTTRSTVTVSDTVGLTIVGNGATLTQTTLGPKTTQRPVLDLDGNVGLTWRGFTVSGSYDGSTDGGVSYEGDGGVLLTGNTTLDLQIDVNDVQGDFVDVLHGAGSSLNTGINWRDSTMTDAGYHGVVLEAVDGITFSGDHFVRIGENAIDLETDIYSTGFDTKGDPIFAAEDDVWFVGDTFRNFAINGGDWFASLQGQTPGVQEQNVNLIGNRIVGSTPLVQVEGTEDAAPQYALSGLNIVGNYSVSPARSTSGGTPGQADVGSVMTILNADDVTVQLNYLPVMTSNGAYLDALKAKNVSGLVDSGNGFPGALNVLHPASSGNSAQQVCANRYGSTGTSRTPSCPSGF